MFHIPDDPHDLAHLFPAVVGGEAGLDSLADNILTGKKFVREALVHDHDRDRFESISLVKDAASPHWNAHRLEIIRGDDADGRAGSLTFRQWTLFNVKGSHHVTAAQRQRQYRTGRFHSGKRADPRQKLVEERDDIFVLRIGAVR